VYNLIIYDKRISSSFKAVDENVREILRIMGEIELLNDESLLFKISFVLREILNNSVEHGNHFDSSKMITCHIKMEDSVLFMEISDEGDGFVRNDVYYEALDNTKRERQRGLKLIEDLNFKIDVEGNNIKLALAL
jgi:two-component sensor histidine kinase